MVALAATATAGVRRLVIGHSVKGRPIIALVRGPNDAPRKILVVGCIHGNECAGLAIVAALERAPIVKGVQLWLVPEMNPDGTAADTRQNADGVDLNRNFPYEWEPVSDPTYYSGPRPLSEPETPRRGPPDPAHPAGGDDLVPPAHGSRRHGRRGPRRGAALRGAGALAGDVSAVPPGHGAGMVESRFPRDHGVRGRVAGGAGRSGGARGSPTRGQGDGARPAVRVADELRAVAGASSAHPPRRPRAHPIALDRRAVRARGPRAGRRSLALSVVAGRRHVLGPKPASPR